MLIIKDSIIFNVKTAYDLANTANEGLCWESSVGVGSVKTKNCIYAFETNFYSGGGSKLNETARSYKMLAEESKNIKGFAFVWVTDGQGWTSAKNNLEETFDVLDNIFNLKELEQGKLKEILK